MPEPEPATIYVAFWGARPVGASAHLGDAKAAAVARHSKYDPEPREYRWEQDRGDDCWQLSTLNPASGRWVRQLTFVYPTPIVDAPDH